MIVFKDVLTDAELLSDAFPIHEVNNAVYEVTCGWSKQDDLSNINIGANPSAEDAAEDLDEDTEKLVDLVVNFQLIYLGDEPSQTRLFSKRNDYKAELGSYLKKVKGVLEANGTDPEEIKAFQKGCNLYYEENIKNNFKNFHFYKGSSDELGMIILLEYLKKDDEKEGEQEGKKDGEKNKAARLIFWKYGLRKEVY